MLTRGVRRNRAVTFLLWAMFRIGDADAARGEKKPMLARPTLRKPPDESAGETRVDQSRPKEERFLLRVDNQTKCSFSSKEPAMTAGAVIKKAFPVVMVSVLDSKDGSVEVIK